MANYVPFEQLKVGETYYMWDSYWREVHGKAKIAELYPNGTGTAYCDWGQDPNSTFCFGVDDGFYNCQFWQEEPTQEECLNQERNGKKYVPPRTIEGKAYSGSSIITGDLKELLDKFIEDMNKTFESDKRFKPDKYDPKHSFLWESKLDYTQPSEIFITHRGRCDWDTIRYVEKNGDVYIHAGERDSCGWLTGVIDKKMPDGSLRSIFYG